MSPSVRSLGVLLSGTVMLTGCATPPPAHPGDICSVFHEKRHWYHVALRQERKWGVPFSGPMAIMYQESGFHSGLHTKRTYFLGFIPWGYVTTAYGYPQAKTNIWREYERATDNDGSRENFADSLDFMNWYMVNTRRQDGVPVTNTFAQYLAYHEGWGGYRARSYRRKPGLTAISMRVARRAEIYAAQFRGCAESLKDKGFWSWLF
ncbi:transglycosylase SLT domain-containing protein [Kozakia baliensis]|uniref:Transglycosylase SLT domain-containing protein n=1 Tax=Kozakia baliensis TaxID=153496 RepID=A0A1D8UUY0_9PROT|nr:hypothetical protein [Kozakia baliensis]AOX17445.1 hypothetical protein A0U89_10170 [Kozakia baliensis]